MYSARTKRTAEVIVVKVNDTVHLLRFASAARAQTAADIIVGLAFAPFASSYSSSSSSSSHNACVASKKSTAQLSTNDDGVDSSQDASHEVRNCSLPLRS
jgi:ABC-type thiamine transport system substrate-binding protein